ncbi:MAG: 1-(5-phosphoribosyl)-5-[(5-phosphoribosylamino)methylideneamino]imidazole-4-carboxamide isomerase [Candidatus Didemnitutus sp.]|nr:1-(5-phosphoribosyl)-5-[(5-phosphoribosylamino)methylideneamino]imidazole-4-carboxamide isomerase [Candidatus Didemnitutus sp.]
MILYPAIDLRLGRVVRLTEGSFEAETAYRNDPEAVAREFAAAGTTWLHLVDLDGAKDPAMRQTALVERVVAASGLRVQSGGGIRDEAQVTALLAAGVTRVIIGSLAVKQPELVGAWLEKFGPERIILALDVRLQPETGVPQVAIAGWRADSGLALAGVIESFLARGLKHLLCTDISRDGKLTGPNFELYTSLRRDYPTLEVQASGGVSSLDDLRRLRADRIPGAIIGRALYEKKFTLAEALAC